MPQAQIFVATPCVDSRAALHEQLRGDLATATRNAPHQFFSTPFEEAKRGKANFIANTVKALDHYLTERSEPYMLWIEDDAIIGQRFQRCLDRAILSEYPAVSFYNPNKIGLTAAQLKLGPACPEGLYEPAGRSNWWSSMALLLTRKAATMSQIVQLDNPKMALDNIMQVIPCAFYCYLPNPIQNRDIDSAHPGNAGGSAQSRTFSG